MTNKRQKSKSIIVTGVIILVVIVYSIFTNNLNMLVNIFSPYNTDFSQAQRYKPENDDALSTVFMSVGQGDCILIMSGDTNILVDAGESSQGEYILDRLAYYGVTHIDAFIATHPHSDHIGGADIILNNITCDLVIMSNGAYDTIQYNQLLNAIKENKIPIKIPNVGETYSLDDIMLTFLSPIAYKKYGHTNDYSVVCVAENEYGNVYLGGDSESSTEEFVLTNPLPDIDVYKASHHGSLTSNTPEFITAIDPEYAIISCGANNDYGHPHQEVIELFEQSGIETFRTDLDGEILVIQDDNGIQIIKK